MLPLYLTTDNLIRIDEVKNPTTGAYINDATGTYSLKDSSGTEVDSGSFSYVSGSNGRYEAVIPYDTTLTNKAKYILEITLVTTPGRDFRRIACLAQYRLEE